MRLLHDFACAHLYDPKRAHLYDAKNTTLYDATGAYVNHCQRALLYDATYGHFYVQGEFFRMCLFPDNNEIPNVRIPPNLGDVLFFSGFHVLPEFLGCRVFPRF